MLSLGQGSLPVCVEKDLCWASAHVTSPGYDRNSYFTLLFPACLPEPTTVPYIRDTGEQALSTVQVCPVSFQPATGLAHRSELFCFCTWQWRLIFLAVSITSLHLTPGWQAP